MKNQADEARRRVIAILASLPFSSAIAEERGTPTNAMAGDVAKLCVYFSRSGNTRVVAGLIQRGLDTDLHEIVPTVPYPEDYLQTVEKAKKERDTKFKPELKSPNVEILKYGMVFLGFPIWGETIPSVIRSFLASNDLAGKMLIPFITHGGYGLGSSQDEIRTLAPKAWIADPFVMEADQERRTMNRVNDWLSKNNYSDESNTGKQG
jgi:flavodoxin